MPSDSVVIKKNYILRISAKLYFRIDDFWLQRKKRIPDLELLLDRIAEQLGHEKEEEKSVEQEAQLLNASFSNHAVLTQCLSPKKSLTRMFYEILTKHVGTSDVDQYNTIISRKIWTYVKLEQDMSPIPFTWAFKLKPCNAEGRRSLRRHVVAFEGIDS